MKSRLQIIVVVVIGLYVSDVCAQSDSKMSAMQYFEEGTSAYNAGEYDNAALYFRRAQELKPSWKLWFNIGQSEAARRKFGLALEAFEKYLAMGGDNVNPARFEEVVAEIRRLRELVGNLEIAGGPDGAKVMVDGVVRTQLPLEVDLRVTAGIPHNVKIIHEDVVLHDQAVTVGSASVVAISLDADGSSAVVNSDIDDGTATAVGADQDNDALNDALNVNSANAKSDNQPRLRPLKIAMISAWGGTLVTLGLGIGFHAAAGKNENELDELNTDFEAGRITSDTYDAEYDPIESDMNRNDTLSTAMFVASGVLATTAIVMTIVYARKRKTANSVVSFSPTGLRLQF